MAAAPPIVPPPAHEEPVRTQEVPAATQEVPAPTVQHTDRAAWEDTQPELRPEAPTHRAAPAAEAPRVAVPVAAPHVAPATNPPHQTVRPPATPQQPLPAATHHATPPPPPAAHVPAGAPRQSRGWWVAPAVVVGLVLIAWLVLAVLPFNRDDDRPATPATETIAEATGPAQTTTLVEDTQGSADDSFEIVTTTTDAPVLAPTATLGTQPPALGTAPATATAPATQTQPPPAQRPVPVQQPAPAPQPAPGQQPAAPPVRTAPQPAGELTAAEATSTLRSYVRSTRFYGVANECVRVENRGYRNEGYNLEVWHSCPGSGGTSRLLGRWRVDAKTREVFRQRDDGRYLRP